MSLVITDSLTMTLAGRYDLTPITAEDASNLVSGDKRVYEPTDIVSTIASDLSVKAVNDALGTELASYSGGYAHDKTEVCLVYMPDGTWFQLTYLPPPA